MSSWLSLQRRVTRRPSRAMLLATITAALGAGIYVITVGRASKGLLIARQGLAVWEAPANAPRDASMVAKGEFELVNQGTSTVRVVDVKSDCGCAVPVITTRIVEPGRSAFVSVSATVVPYLSRDLGINVQTDSSIAPDVFLRLRVVGNQRPPLLLDASGDLSFVGVLSTDEQREMTVITVEREGESKTPTISSDLPFLRFEEGGKEAVPQGGDLRLLKRSYWVGLSRTPPAGTSAGSVTVTDPWDSRNNKALNVFVQPQSTIVCAPSSLKLKPGGCKWCCSSQPTGP